MPTMAPELYVKDRLEDQIQWYGDRSQSYQRSYKWFRTLEIRRGAQPGEVPVSDRVGTARRPGRVSPARR